MRNTQDDSGGKVSVLRSDTIGVCEKRFHMNMCLLILDAYQDRAVLTSKTKCVRFLFMGSDERQSLQTKSGWLYETNFSLILDVATHKSKRENQLRRKTRDFHTRVAKRVEADGGIFDIYCELPHIYNFCLTNLSVKP